MHFCALKCIQMYIQYHSVHLVQRVSITAYHQHKCNEMSNFVFRMLIKKYKQFVCKAVVLLAKSDIFSKIVESIFREMYVVLTVRSRKPSHNRARYLRHPRDLDLQSLSGLQWIITFGKILDLFVFFIGRSKITAAEEFPQSKGET